MFSDLPTTYFISVEIGALYKVENLLVVGRPIGRGMFYRMA
jgi:hypothetical protein